MAVRPLQRELDNKQTILRKHTMNILSIESGLIIDWAYQTVTRLYPKKSQLHRVIIAVAVRDNQPRQIKQYLTNSDFKQDLDNFYDGYLKHITHRNKSVIQEVRQLLANNH